MTTIATTPTMAPTGRKKRTMHGFCHKCRHNEAVQAGQYDSVPFMDSPCANCELVESSIDTLPFNDEVLHPSLARPAADEAPLHVKVFGEFMAGVMQMPQKMRDTMFLRAAGMTNEEIGEGMGVTRHTIVTRMRREIAKWPTLREFIPDQRVSRSKKQEKLRKRSGLAGLA